MALSKQFARKLDDLWKRRTSDIHALIVKPSAGKPKLFSRKLRDDRIAELLQIATNIFISKEAKKEFKKIVKKRKLRKINGRGLLNRGYNLTDWAGGVFAKSGPIVYAFWRRDRCLYVGKGATWKRLKNYKKSAYLLEASSIEVFAIRGRSNLGKAECLAKHIFKPRDNQIDAAKPKWGKSCSVCGKHDQIRSELHYLFALK